MKRDKYVMCLCLILAVLGISGKGLTKLKSSDLSAIDTFAAAAKEIGMTRHDGRNLTIDGTYKATVFRDLNCDGALIVVPLPRNAEGADLLSRSLRRPPTQQFFLLFSERYATFPNVAFWFSGLRHDVMWLLNMTNAPPPVVLSVAEIGECELGMRLASSHLS
ncbi:MAG: hypothetical protein COB59_03825 [Rhodospirillaceae bacterium]|nr:MAG: hypothetical protein COB59_03825 [Rhodospirillaceae bacterium]